MYIPRIFICYYPNNEQGTDQQLVQQLITDLRNAGAEIIYDEGKNSDAEFLQLLARELPTCQWVIFAQTTETLQAPRANIVFNTARKLIEQEALKGTMRIITASNDDSQRLPAGWEEMKAYDLRVDYPKALEKILFAFSMDDSGSVPVYNEPTIVQAPPQPQLQNSVLPVESLPPPPVPQRSSSHFSSPPPTYDRPLAPVPRSARFNTLQYSINRKFLFITGTIVLIAIVLFASISVYLSVTKSTPAPNPIAGYAYFTSSGWTNGNGITGINDGLQIKLNNISAPPSGSSYYAWLLSDDQQSEANPLPLGSLQFQNGIAQLSYPSDPHDNLLSQHSRLLITEESSSVPPQSPSSNKEQWLYYAEIPQNASGMNMGSDTMSEGSMSQLDHLRHLLYNDPKLQKLNLQGGVSYWFHQNTEAILQAAESARTTRSESNINTAVRLILDYIDGKNYVQQDVTGGVPELADQPNSQVGLLNIDTENEDPPGYVTYMGNHLTGLTNAPGATDSEKSQIFQIGTALNNVGLNLKTIRNDAKNLIAELNSLPKANPKDKHYHEPILNTNDGINTLNDMYAQSIAMYYGQYDPTTGNRVGGSLWITDHIQYLAMLTVKKYGAQ
jgi:hypothetical protein